VITLAWTDADAGRVARYGSYARMNLALFAEVDSATGFNGASAGTG